jgi:hypothetical protein
MSRPLLITDCDEVLLHMVRHFGAWLHEAHAIRFAPEGASFANAMTRAGQAVPEAEVWPLLDGFFRTEMDRQTLVPGAAEALGQIGEIADIVVLTNLQDWCEQGRSDQLARHGIRHRVCCNQGGKGPAVARLLTEYGPAAAVFVDDLAVHHQSVADHAPGVWRLHLIAEPSMAASVPPAPAAHARIDAWDRAGEWIRARLSEARPALDARVPAEESGA